MTSFYLGFLVPALIGCSQLALPLAWNAVRVNEVFIRLEIKSFKGSSEFRKPPVFSIRARSSPLLKLLDV